MHVGLTWDGSTLRYYHEGQPAGEISATGAGSFPIFAIGGAEPGDPETFHGRISQVLLWDRALSGEEISSRAAQTPVWPTSCGMCLVTRGHPSLSVIWKARLGNQTRTIRLEIRP